jgi:ATP-dependent helicase/nuclease subunit A
VVAGPGSGKTTVLVERYRSLVEERRFEPRNILAITFTEKAAANMKAKLAELFAHDPLRLRDLESAYVSTIHGFCARILRENAIAAGIDPRFAVLDARESEELQYSCLNAALDELVELRRAEALELIATLQSPYFSGDLRSAYDGIRSSGKTVAEIRAMENPGANVAPGEMATTLRRLVANWPANLSAARQTQRAALLEWAQRLSEAGDGEATSLEDFVRLVKACPLHLGKVPESGKEVLAEFKKALPHLIASAVDRCTARFRAIVFDVLARFDELYTERKLAAGALDFNDLERRTVDLLRRNEDVKTRTRAQFRQVMLDEFQDINEQQSDLIQLVRGDDVFFAVGDVNQSIYGFRHARPEIFHDYRAEIDASGKHSVNLLDNFRSRTEILRCVESLLNAAEGIDPRSLVAGASFANKQSPSIEVLKIHTINEESEAAEDGSEDDEPAAKEARWIAHRILSLRGTLELGADGKTRYADFADFAVLCRAGDSMKPILEAFDRTCIPYVSGRRQSFLLSREGLDITALLHTIANPRDAISLATVLRSPLVGLGDEALLRLRLLGSSLPAGLNAIAYDSDRLKDFAPEDAAKIEQFARNLRNWRDTQPVMPLELLLVRALTACGFQWTPGTVIADNIESFLQLARNRGEQRGLGGFLSEIESLQKAINLESDLSDKDQGNSVQVMTAHSAKGLEFPVTIIAAMDKGTQRNSAPVTFTPDFGLGLKWADKTGKRNNTGLEDSWQLLNAEQLKDREKQESHRLLYVAMTRAEEHLILSYSRGKNRPSNWAKLLDGLFQLESFEPANEPYQATVPSPNGDTFDISIRVSDSDPPVLYASDTDRATSGGVLTLDRPGISGQYDSSVNVTSLAVFADCPRKYYLQRYIGWNGRSFSKYDPEDSPPEEDESTDLTAADLGSVVHEILAGKPGIYPAEAQRLADVFLTSELGRRAASAPSAAREWDFIVDINGTLVRGTIDLWFKKNDEIAIVDYKTDTVKVSDAATRATSYTPQLALYALAIERAFGKRPSHAWLHFLRPDTLVEVPIDASAIQQVEGLLADLRTAQDTLQFELREGDHCRACAYYRGLCPAGLEQPE